MAGEWPSIRGATLNFVTAMQVPGAIDPMAQRHADVLALLGRVLMVPTVASHGLAREPAFPWFAAFDLAFGAVICLGFRRMAIADLLTRP